MIYVALANRITRTPSPYSLRSRPLFRGPPE
jgi:hypothetical protein